MRELSVFIDESGTQEGRTRYYLVTLVLHDQSESLQSYLTDFEASLNERQLPDVPFHATPLLRGNEDFAGLDSETRSRLLVSFAAFVRRLPIRYKTFSYRNSEVGGAEKLQAIIRRDLVDFIVNHLDYFQSFDKVKIYYDGGQDAVTRAVHAAFEYALSRDVTTYRDSSYSAYRLAQAADYLCEIELAAIKFEHHEETRTDIRFFRSYSAFKKNWLKQARRKLFA